MTQWAIVALPTEDDGVQKLSSEKVPHLTLLYFGEQEGEEKASRIAQFLQHAAKTSLRRFGLSVDRRGELGDNKADVLFFEKDGYSYKDLVEFRAYLLTDDDIYEAYSSVSQYPEWTPHLTLGFPETPAKPDESEYPKHWVNFDRVALWTGDYEGPEFVLNRESYMDEVAMSSIKEAVDEALAHYGIPGMRWGVRRKTGSDGLVVKTASSTSSSSKKTDEDLQKSADYERATKAYAKASSKGIQSLSNEEINAIAKRIEAEKKFNQLTNDQKSEMQKEVESLRLEADYRKLKSEKAMATRSTARKILDSLIKSAAETASNQAANYGKQLINDMLKEASADKLAKSPKQKRPFPFKVNPTKVTVTPTVTNGLATR